jgi:hypothetical protein
MRSMDFVLTRNDLIQFKVGPVGLRLDLQVTKRMETAI